MLNRVLIKILLLAATLTDVFFLSGCWDYKEIEKRGYVLGIAIDKAESETLDVKQLEYMPLESRGQLYAFTIEIPVISKSRNKPGSQGSGGGDTERDWNLTVVSNSFFEASREFSTRLDYAPFYPHLQSIVISESAARTDMLKLFDVFIRTPEVRRRTKVFITPGRASDILRVIPKIDDYSSLYLKALPLNSTKTSRLLHKTDLGKISEDMHANRCFVLPKVISDKNEIKDAGCAVFKDKKMVGWLDEIKTGYLKWIRNHVRGGVVSVNMPQWENHPVVLVIKKVKTKQRPMMRGNSAAMELDIKANLSVADLSLPVTPNVLDEAFLSQLEKLAEEKIQKQIEDTISYVQRQYGSDIFFFDVNFQRFAPAAWDKVKDKWDDVFKTLKVTVNVKVKINQIGLIK